MREQIESLYKKGMKFKNKDENYKRPLEILEVIGGGFYLASYDPDFSENTHTVTSVELEKNFKQIK